MVVGVHDPPSIRALNEQPRYCGFPDCSNEYRAAGYCASHYAQVARGKPLTPIRRRPVGYRQDIRTLRPGERVPSHAPKRYINGSGYIRLRWLVGTGQYVETYEHRVFNGCVTEAEHVHHRNGVRSDNRHCNLQPLTAEEHSAHHASEREGQRRWEPYRSYEAMWKAAHADNRRFDTARRTEMILRLREAGLTQAEIGLAVGLSGCSVSRYINHGRNP